MVDGRNLCCCECRTSAAERPGEVRVCIFGIGEIRKHRSLPALGMTLPLSERPNPKRDAHDRRHSEQQQ